MKCLKKGCHGEMSLDESHNSQGMPFYRCDTCGKPVGADIVGEMISEHESQVAEMKLKERAAEGW